jgi:hypothetical protein
MKTGMIVLAALTATAAMAQEDKPYGALRPDQAAYRALYKEMLETNTTPTTGSCTEAAAKIAGHLKEASPQYCPAPTRA